MIGATNVLFKQKRGVAEVIVDIEKDKIDILDAELKKALQLTTEDLRYMYISKRICCCSLVLGVCWHSAFADYWGLMTLGVSGSVGLGG
jgi:hypothetical protein